MQRLPLSLSLLLSENTCNDGDLRLVEGMVNGEGRVEICLDGSFSTICDDGWGSADAQVVCRQLGYNNGTSTCVCVCVWRGRSIESV